MRQPSASTTIRLRAEPLKRLVDVGVRLNALRGAKELQECLIDEVTNVSGAPGSPHKNGRVFDPDR
jgi:hypothetical protein